MLLEYHEKGEDYLFVFDYHDDLVILNSESKPTKYKFFQIKAKETGNWSLNGLFKRKTGKTNVLLPSVLGKMHDHLLNFPSNAESITFLSNSKLSIKINGSPKQRVYENICFNKLDQYNSRIIQTALEKEIAPNKLHTDFFNVSFYASHNLSIKESSTHTKGKVSEFLERRSKGKKYNVESVYKNIFDEVKRKNNDTSIFSDFDQFKERKGIGRSNLEEILSLIGERKDYDQIWQVVNNDLKSANVSFGDILHYRSLWKKLEVDRMDPTNYSLQNCIKITRETISGLQEKDQLSGQTLMHLSRAVAAKLREGNHVFPFSENYVQTIIFAQLYD